MYQGDANVNEHNLPSILEIAEDLNVRSLCERNTDGFKSDRENTSQVNNLSSKEEYINDKVKNTSGHHYHIDDIDTKTLITPKNSNDEFKQVYVQNKKKNVVRTAAVQDAAESHQCSECDYKTKHMGHFKEHTKSIHEVVGYSCDQCDYKETSKSHLTSHVKSMHEGVRYPCDQCDYKAIRTRYLQDHQLTNHN